MSTPPSNQKWHFTGPVKVAGEGLDVGATLDTLGSSNAWHRPLFGNACTGVKGQEFDYYFRD